MKWVKIRVGDIVRMRDGRPWQIAEISTKGQTPGRALIRTLRPDLKGAPPVGIVRLNDEADLIQRGHTGTAVDALEAAGLPVAQVLSEDSLDEVQR